MLTLNYAAASDRGLVRSNNEDSAYAGSHLLALADGMGGHAAGEVASQLMINHLEVLDADPGDNDMCALLGGVANDGNHTIGRESAHNPHMAGMGTTLTAFLFDGATFAMIHVGDSRAYRLRNNALEQVTVDDTFVQSLVDKGQLDPADISTHPKRSFILKAYTGDPVEPTLRHFDARPGDRLLLCSDGLSDPVSFETIEEVLRHGQPMEVCRKLIDLALRSGGPDNVTVVVADVVDTDSPDVPRKLPVTPMVAGALNTSDQERPRPDTSAGRASLLAMSATGAGAAPAGAAGASQPEDSPHDELPVDAVADPEYSAENAPQDHTRRSRRWVTVSIVLAVILTLIIGGWMAARKLDDTYYLAIDDSAAIRIERGSAIRILGHDLHHPHQAACLDKSGNLMLTDAAHPSRKCSLFRVNALPESTRESLHHLSSGSYDEIVQQLQRLAADALPVCVKSGSSTLNKPGVNCREVK